jgi:hypothetical protein
VGVLICFYSKDIVLFLFFEVRTLTSDDASPEEKEEKLVNLARC